MSLQQLGSLLWRRLHPGPGNFHAPSRQPHRLSSALDIRIILKGPPSEESICPWFPGGPSNTEMSVHLKLLFKLWGTPPFPPRLLPRRVSPFIQ